jgi:predicted metal-dependent peptidase|tara:strand:- start:5321 stop:6514 length:1194 start_codon:yes stop_codon:yes gene_type:complete
MLALGKQLTVEQRVSKAVVDIMGSPKYVALAGVLMIGERTVRDDIPTACTNGRDEMYGRAFVEGLPDPELRFLVLHECYHKLYRHLTTWRHLYEEDPRLANQACDYVINNKITDDNKEGFAVMPEGGLLDNTFTGMDSAQVYNLLKQEKEDNGGQGRGQSGEGFDDHDWEGAQELTETEQRGLARDIDEAIRQGALIAGKLGTGVDRDLTELLQPQVDWREAMREFISTTCSGNDYSTWKRPNRRFVATGVYMPSGISESVEGVVVAGDMSGSIGQREQSVILTEAKQMFDTVHPSWVRMLYWDTQVCSDEKYEQHELDDFVKSTKPKGGGGTNVKCVPAHMSKQGIKAQAAIVITDGYLGGSWGKWDCPVLWVIIDNKNAKPDVGLAIHVNTRDLI